MKELIEKIKALPEGDVVIESMQGTMVREYIDTPLHTDDLKALAAAVPRWIPCEQRLPHRGGDYLVTFSFGFVQEVEFRKGQHREIGRWITEFGDREVIAWMPLPEPCTVEEN